MERAYLQWNLVNFVTVVLMATVGITLVGFGKKLVSGGGSDTGDDT